MSNHASSNPQRMRRAYRSLRFAAVARLSKSVGMFGLCG